MFEHALVRAASYIAGELNLPGEDEEVFLFALRLLVHSIVGSLLILAAGWLTGSLSQVMAAAVTAATLRVFSGGAHAGTPWRCVILGAVLFALIGNTGSWVAAAGRDGLLLLLLLTAATGLVVIYRFAPADTPGKPIKSKAKKARLRLGAASVTVFWTVSWYAVLGSSALGYSVVAAGILGMLWQFFSLTPTAYRLGWKLDAFLDGLSGKEGCSC